MDKIDLTGVVESVPDDWESEALTVPAQCMHPNCDEMVTVVADPVETSLGLILCSGGKEGHFHQWRNADFSHEWLLTHGLAYKGSQNTIHKWLTNSVPVHAAP